MENGACPEKNDRDSEASSTMSKKQRKRLMKHQMFLEKRKIKRQEKRERKKEEKRKLREERKADGSEALINVAGAFPKRFKSMASKEASSLRIAIDLSFDDFMSDRDMMKLLKQVQRTYSVNRRAEHPVQLYLTSFGDKVKRKLNEIKCNYEQWDIHIKPEPYSEVFPKEDVIYLTSDSPNVLSEVEESKAYIIGGLVDHNHQKGLCYKLAIERDIAHAQLPISEFVKLNSRKVLVVNHVFEILLRFTESKDWKDAFYKVLPARKIVPDRNESEEEIGGSEEFKRDSEESDKTKEEVTCS